MRISVVKVMGRNAGFVAAGATRLRMMSGLSRSAAACSAATSSTARKAFVVLAEADLRSVQLLSAGPDAGAKLLADSHATTNPPSTTRSTPVTYAASSEIRNATAPCDVRQCSRSSASGMRASKDCFAALAPPCPEAISSPRPSRALVSMKPGDMLAVSNPKCNRAA